MTCVAIPPAYSVTRGLIRCIQATALHAAYLPHRHELHIICTHHTKIVSILQEMRLACCSGWFVIKKLKVAGEDG